MAVDWFYHCHVCRVYGGACVLSSVVPVAVAVPVVACEWTRDCPQIQVTGPCHVQVNHFHLAHFQCWVNHHNWNV